MDTHCGWHESLVFHGKVRDADEAVSVCLQPGLQYAIRFGVPGTELTVSFSVEHRHVRGDHDWERFGDSYWTYLTVTFDGVTYTVWVSQPKSDDDLPNGHFHMTGEGIDSRFDLEPASIISELPFD